LKYIKNLLKFSIVLLLLLVCLGSIHAADDVNVNLTESSEDIDFDEDLDDEGDDDSADDDLDDEGDDDLTDEDDNESDYTFSDFDYLKFKITHYLDNYGNCSCHNWTESEEFLNEYQVYLLNPSNYTLNESSEGYETYLKIYDSVTVTFKDYNLTENETGYLKFMVIFYLNHYGNVSSNHTWNESESFANYTPPLYLLGAIFKDVAMELTSQESAFNVHSSYYSIYSPLSNSTDVNQTVTDNLVNDVPHDSQDYNIFVVLVLVIILMILIFL